MKNNVVLTGLVLRATPQGEYNKIITLLTADRGLVSVYCYGAMSVKNGNFASTQPFCYSELEVSEGKEGYTLKGGSVIKYFQNDRMGLLETSFIMYCAEVLLYVCCEDNDEEDMLRLALNLLYAALEKKRDIRMIKAVFELRCALYQGFTPELDGCMECGGEIGWFDYVEGGGFCKKHSEAKVGDYGGNGMFISPYSLSSMQYVLNCQPKKILSFALPEEYIKEFSTVCEKYLEYQLEHRFTSLDFYHTAEDMTFN